MRNREIILSVTAGICLIVICVSLAIAAGIRNTPEEPAGEPHGLLDNGAEADPDMEDEEETEAYLYVVKEFNGKVAVFQDGQELPEYVFDVYVESLPLSDQRHLAEGITAKDPAQLRSLIEDYSS